MGSAIMRPRSSIVRRALEASTPISVRERQIASLGPLFSVAGLFAVPAASTLAPFILFLFLRKRSLPFATQHALRAADLAFSIHLLVLVTGLGLMLLAALFPGQLPFAPEAMTRGLGLFFLAAYLSLMVVGWIQALRGKPIRYVISFRLAERIFDALGRRGTQGLPERRQGR